jgi:hypothetical protein
MKSYISIDNTTNKISIDLNFFNRLFIKKPPKAEKLTALSLRVIALLLQSMSDIEPRNLPSRTKMAKTLGVSTVAINNTLFQLDVNGFLVRAPEGMDGIVCVDDKVTRMYQRQTAERICNDREQKKFSGKFVISSNYNITTEEYIKESVEATIEHFISAHPEIRIDMIRKKLAKEFEAQLQTILDEECSKQKKLEQEEDHD